MCAGVPFLALSAVEVAFASAGVQCLCPQISHVIPLQVLQPLKSERWNSAVFGVLHGMAARELRAELVDMWLVAGRSPRLCL